MYQELLDKKKQIAVIGLGYVGLPLALEFAKYFKVIGFDINERRIQMMQNNIDPSSELDSSAFEHKDIFFTADKEHLKKAHFFIVAVPTDIDEHKVPNLRPLLGASRTVAYGLKKGDYVVFESTVYPGCTEEDCLPILEQETGLKVGKDFKIGYSPERINPGDKEHTVSKILKIVAGNDDEALETVAAVYSKAIIAGVYKAKNIKVAEAAKVIENSQRDINIAFVNELSMIFDKMDIDTKAVLEAAGTKWNFLKFQPGLVGGHCIGVDPYYLAHKALQIGYDPQVILSGRRINDSMPAHVAKRLVQLLTQKGKNPSQSKVLVMGLTFKENVTDIRNSKVVGIINELIEYSVNVEVIDANASKSEVLHEYNINLLENLSDGYDAVLVAVAHDEYKSYQEEFFTSLMNENPILMDLKGIYNFSNPDLTYWRL